MGRRHLFMASLLIISIALFWTSLRTVAHYAVWEDSRYDKYSYTMAIPFICMALVYFERQRIFACVRYAWGTGTMLFIAALVVGGWASSLRARLSADVRISVSMLALLLVWVAAFVLCYGTAALRAGSFPFLFLLFTVPLPDVLLDKPITMVQYGSTAVCSFLFTVAGIPVVHSGLQFSLSNVTIEVARECSGIHSTIAIFITSLIAGHLFLRSAWKKFVLVAVALPVVCVTNGLRIAGLTLLAEYVNPNILHSGLHRNGGMGFFALALAALFGILQLLRTRDERTPLTPASKTDALSKLLVS